MSGKKFRALGFAICIIILLLMAVPAVSATVTYYSQEEPVISPEGLKINSYKIFGDLPDVFTDDDITALYMLQYESTGYNQLVIDQPGGLFFVITDPQGNSARSGSNYIGKTIYPGDYINVKETISFDKPGVWKISPGYTVITGAGMQKVSNPKDWQVAEINVIGRENPKPDLIIENIMADFDSVNGIISRISYTIRNIGDADSDPSITALFADSNRIDTVSNVGYLPPGESITIFEPVSVKYSGSTSLIEAQADYNEQINETDDENNLYETIIDNPGFADSFENTGGGVISNINTISDSNTRPSVAAEYNQCSVQVQGCADICFICGVVGLLSILLSILSFALGYFYGLNKNCENQVRWMRSKIDFLRSDKDDCKITLDEEDEDITEKMEEELEKAIDNLKNNKQE